MIPALRALCAALLAFPAIHVGAEETAGLFSADSRAAPPRQMSERLRRQHSFPEAELHGEAAGELAPSPELRSRIATIDFGQLAAARSEEAKRSLPDRRRAPPP